MNLLGLVDNIFLGQELSEASQLHRKLKREISQGQAQINRQNQEVNRLEDVAESLRVQVGGLRNKIASLTREKIAAATKIAQLAERFDELNAEINRERALQLKALTREISQFKAAEIERANSELQAQKTTLEGNYTAAAKNLLTKHQQLKEKLQSAAATLQASHNDRKQQLTDEYTEAARTWLELYLGTVAGIRSDLQNRESQLSRVDAELAQKWAEAEAELHRRSGELQGQLQARIDSRKVELEQLEAQIRERLRIAEHEEEERIRVMRKAFEVEQNAAILELKEAQIDASENLKASKAQIIEEYRGAIEQPLLEEIAALTIELGRVKKKISKENLNWQPNQIREFFVKDREGRAEPTHVRIGGASESGKSYMINQLVSGGLESMGVEDVDFFLLDPYGSDTKWDIKPNVYDDAEAAAEIVRDWGKNAKGDKLPRPTILMIDEFDTLVAEFDLAQAVKDVVKLGRHRNRFLWMIGQSGNCPKGFTWTDVKNLNQLYLGSVAEDYVNNGLKGRNKNKWLGEIEALREKSKFHAIITPKDRNPYTIFIPAQLFPGVSAGTAADTAPSSETALKCPKCGSQQVSKDGTYKYKGVPKQRLKCSACGKGSSVPIE